MGATELGFQGLGRSWAQRGLFRRDSRLLSPVQIFPSRRGGRFVLLPLCFCHEALGIGPGELTGCAKITS